MGIDIKALESAIADAINHPSELLGVCLTVNEAQEVLDLLKEQEDMGKELTDAIELVHKKNARIIGLTDLLKERPEIIRCKDCKFYKKPEYGFTKGDCTYGSVWYQTEEDGFCSKAKVKD